MKFAQSSIARPTFADRNNVTKGSTYGPVTLAPHASTARWSYTTPAAKKNQSSILSATVRRDTAAAPVGAASVTIQLTPSGGAAALIAYANIFNNTIGAQDGFAFGPQLVLMPGDAITARSEDLSTGGTCTYTTAHAFGEYDA